MYVVNGFRYVGTDEAHTKDEQVSDQVIMLLLKMYLNKGRNVTIDNYFTSMKLTSELQKIKKQLTGNSEQNPQSTCSGDAHERATSLPHTL